jgi:hypothetical protein
MPKMQYQFVAGSRGNNAVRMVINGRTNTGTHACTHAIWLSAECDFFSEAYNSCEQNPLLRAVKVQLNNMDVERLQKFPGLPHVAVGCGFANVTALLGTSHITADPQ